MLNGGCHQVCENTVGGRNCSCNPGFELSEDMRTCTGNLMHIVDVSDHAL